MPEESQHVAHLCRAENSTTFLCAGYLDLLAELTSVPDTTYEQWQGGLAPKSAAPSCVRMQIYGGAETFLQIKGLGQWHRVDVFEGAHLCHILGRAVQNLTCS